MKTYKLVINKTYARYTMRISSDSNAGSVFANGVGFLYSTKDVKGTAHRLLSEVASHEDGEWVEVKK